jgi:UDP-N-acetylglucosamine--N-acetylmuramyl-(pentapeptide) pyrophosphoryl-undecaprenol N-acetylglucosamine transferase
LGGSLGAQPLNESVPLAVAALDAADRARIVVRHQCGPQHATASQLAWAAADYDAVDIEPFIEDMADAYRWADLVVCRSGALTVSELAAAGRASVLVPLPHAIDDHQTSNAQTLSSQKAAILMPQADFQAGALTKALQALMNDPAALQRMSERARAMAKLQATEQVADLLEEVASDW